jgi:hypothetical protein
MTRLPQGPGRPVRRSRQASALVWVLLLLTGLPAGLITYVGWPLPTRWRSLQGWVQWASTLFTQQGAVNLFALLLWALWLVVAAALLIDVAVRIRRLLARLTRPRLPPLPATLQAAAHSVLGVAVLSTATTQPPPPAQVAVAATAPPAAPHTTPDQQAAHHPADRVGLPDGGGWVTPHTAAAVAAANSLLWRQRRRLYRPRPILNPVRTDPDLTPLPRTIAAIIGHTQPPVDQPPTAAGTATTETPTLEAGLPPGLAEIPAGGVGLTGPAAHDAVRGALIAALLSAAATPTQPGVVTTTSTLTQLLQSQTPTEAAGLHVADTLHDAVTVLETLAIHRATHPTTGTYPAVLLITEPPTDMLTHRLALLLGLARPQHVLGLFLSQWAPGTTWQIHPDGRTEPDHGTPPPARLSVLTPAATRDLIQLHGHLQQPARPGPGPLPGQHMPEHHNHQPLTPSTATTRAADTGDDPTVSSTSRPLRLRILGAPAVHRTDTGKAIRMPRSAALPVLVYLALHPQGATTPDLCLALWPELHPHDIANRVHILISTLRRILDPLAGTTIIERTDDRYRLQPATIDVDLWQLQQAVRTAQVTTDPTRHARALQHVIVGYTGHLATGWRWPWLDPHREAALRHVLDAYAALAATQPDPDTADQLRQAAARLAPDNQWLTMDQPC